MKDSRYLEIKKENDTLISHLTGSYQKIAIIYIKKARGYASKTIDTEMKIQDTLKVLEDYDIRKVGYHSAISDETTFIEGNIAKLSKQTKDPDRMKTIISLSLIVIFIIAWVVISIWMRQDTKAYPPQNVVCEIEEENQIKVSWDKSNFASNGYYVWVEDLNGNIKEGKYNVMEEQYIFTLDITQSYMFCVQVKETDFLALSNPTKVKFNPIDK